MHKGLWWQICDFRHIRKYLTCEAAKHACNTLVGICLDYCNSPCKCMSNTSVKTTVVSLSSLPRITTNISKFSRITPVLKDLPQFLYPLYPSHLPSVSGNLPAMPSDFLLLVFGPWNGISVTRFTCKHHIKFCHALWEN